MPELPLLPRMSYVDAAAVAPGVPERLSGESIPGDAPRELTAAHRLPKHTVVLEWPDAPYPFAYPAQVGTEKGMILVTPQVPLVWDVFTANRAAGLAGIRQAVREGFAEHIMWSAPARKALANA